MADTFDFEIVTPASSMLSLQAELVIIPGATHLFEEPGALEEVARLAADQLDQHVREDAGADAVSVTAMCRSRSCWSETVVGAPVSGSEALFVFGKAITSRIDDSRC